jgi:hypothetical protein
MIPAEPKLSAPAKTFLKTGTRIDHATEYVWNMLPNKKCANIQWSNGFDKTSVPH